MHLRKRILFQNIIKNDFIIKYPEFNKQEEIQKIRPESISIATNISIKNSSEGGRHVDNTSAMPTASTTLSLISTRLLYQLLTGQYPRLIIAKTSVSNFNIRAGLSILGFRVTLRSKQL